MSTTPNTPTAGTAASPASGSIDFTSFLKLMAHQKASDLFITAGMPPSMKVHGKITPITQSPLTPQQSRDLVLNVMTPPQREEFERTHECNFAIGVASVLMIGGNASSSTLGILVSIRRNTMPTWLRW